MLARASNLACEHTKVISQFAIFCSLFYRTVGYTAYHAIKRLVLPLVAWIDINNMKIVSLWVIFFVQLQLRRDIIYKLKTYIAVISLRFCIERITARRRKKRYGDTKKLFSFFLRQQEIATVSSCICIYLYKRGKESMYLWCFIERLWEPFNRLFTPNAQYNSHHRRLLSLFFP